jgi:membrane protease subunit HflK
VQISREVKDEMQKILDSYKAGVSLVTVELQDVTPPDPVKPAFNEVNEARQDRERTINQSQEQANREIPKARGEAARTVTEAEGYALERVNRARGEADRFVSVLAEYQRAPDVTRKRLYLEALKAMLPTARSLYVVDADQKAMVPLLPLGSAPPSVPGEKRSTFPASWRPCSPAVLWSRPAPSSSRSPNGSRRSSSSSAARSASRSRSRVCT